MSLFTWKCEEKGGFRREKKGSRRRIAGPRLLLLFLHGNIKRKLVSQKQEKKGSRKKKIGL